MPGISITSANASVQLTIPGVYSSGVLLENFAVNDIVDTEPQTLAEGRVGAPIALPPGSSPRLRLATRFVSPIASTSNTAVAWG